MEILKVGLVVAAGLGSTWVAREATDALLGTEPRQRLVQAAAEPRPEPGDSTPAPAAGAQTMPMPEISREEMEAELRRARAEASSGAREDELREFRPTRPLPADLPIALPSDI